MGIKNKLLKITATTLAAGIMTGVGLNVKLPNKFYNTFDRSKAVLDMDKMEQNDFYDPNGNKFLLSREESPNVFDACKIRINDNTIKIKIDENLDKEFYEPSIKAIELYQKIFSLINPNIKVELGNFEKDCDILINSSTKKEYGYFNMQNAADTSGCFFYKDSTVPYMCRGDILSSVNLYDLAKEDKAKSSGIAMTIVHELAHAICGFDDYLKVIPKKTEEFTIMNYNNIDNLKAVVSDPKITPVDLALMIKQWGLFYNEDPTWNNPFSSKEEYLNNINEHLNEVCFTENQLNLTNNIWTSAEGKVSILNYIDITKNKTTGLEDWYAKHPVDENEVITNTTSQDEESGLSQ